MKWKKVNAGQHDTAGFAMRLAVNVLAIMAMIGLILLLLNGRLKIAPKPPQQPVIHMPGESAMYWPPCCWREPNNEVICAV